jgi:hypothetical protein
MLSDKLGNEIMVILLLDIIDQIKEIVLVDIDEILLARK